MSNDKSVAIQELGEVLKKTDADTAPANHSRVETVDIGATVDEYLAAKAAEKAAKARLQAARHALIEYSSITGEMEIAGNSGGRVGVVPCDDVSLAKTSINEDGKEHKDYPPHSLLVRGVRLFNGGLGRFLTLSSRQSLDQRSNLLAFQPETRTQKEFKNELLDYSHIEGYVRIVRK